MRVRIENMISPDYVLCYIPRANENFGKILNILQIFENWKFLNYDFQSKRQIMTARRLYGDVTLKVVN